MTGRTVVYALFFYSCEQIDLICEETTLESLSYGQTPFSPYRKTFLTICENAHQIHFGSQCATERVYRYLPAKVKLKKSHFGKESLIECALRRPPCQSEFAGLREPRTILDLVNSFHQLDNSFWQHRISVVIFRCILKK